MPMIEWPAWRYGPNGAAEVFNDEADVPKGWHDHPSKVITPEQTGGKPLATVTDKIPASKTGGAPVVVVDPLHDAKANATLRQQAGDVSSTLDADGWAWDGEKHSATKSLTTAGLWRMKVGVKRPDAKPGYPIDPNKAALDEAAKEGQDKPAPAPVVDLDL